jgi:hypothetical protein
MKRPLIILFILLALFAIFFYFSLGTEPKIVGEEVSPPPPTTSYLDAVIQKNYPNYVYLEGIGYVQKNRRAVIFTSDSTSKDGHSDEIKEIEERLESYWKWQIIAGNQNLEDINSERKGNGQSSDSRKNIFSRIIDVFRVADAVNVVVDKSQTCDCDPNFLLLSGPDLHKVKATLNPDTPVIASGNQSEFSNSDFFKSKFTKQNSKEPEVGYGKEKIFIVGIIDSGINFGSIIPAKSPDATLDYNFLDHSANVTDASIGIHGTAITNIIESNSSLNIKYVGLKTFDEKSVGNLYNNLCAILYSIKHNIKVVNVSWGVATNQTAFEAVMQQAQKANMVVVCSAGNQKVDIDVNNWFPACYANNPVFGNNIVSVTSKYDSVVCQNTSGSETKIDLSAKADKDCKHDGFIGTSFAAPYAVAEIVKYMTSNPTFSKPTFISSLTPSSKVEKFRK